MRSATSNVSLLRRFGIALFGRPIQALLNWQSAYWYRAARSLSKNAPPATLNAASKLQADSRDKAYQWTEKVFRQSSGFPQPGWAARGGLDGWSGIAPERVGKAIPMDYLCQAKLLHNLLGAPDAPWDDPKCEKDMLSLLSAQARFISGSSCSAYSGGSALRQIPTHLPHLATHFRKEAALLDPEWHLRDPLDHPDYRGVSNSKDWQEQVAFAKTTQAAFLEKEALDVSTNKPAAPGSQSKARL